jgi:predicted AlkP superfamily pyrophosphatase or phosphodiesterase
MHRLARRLAPAALLALAAVAAAVASAETRPRLVLVIAVDQLRPDRIGPDLPGGIGRLLREGRVYREAALEHAVTETCPGHAVILTGRHPGATGLVGNRFFDLEADRTVYCVEDAEESGRLLGPAAPGRSPRNLRVTALGDWMKQAEAGTRVFAVAGKDRSAIALGGKRADAAYWPSELPPIGFTSSRYYLAALPDWVAAFNGSDPPRDGFFASLPDIWEHLPAAAGRSPRPDDFEGESEELSRTSPHPLRDPDPGTFADRLGASPYLDEVTLRFAEQLVRREGLGRGAAPDLLGLGLSATDSVGHRYGPYSHESADALLRLDAALGRFLEFLEGELGAGSVAAVLTADHGVLPLPEWLAATGESRCPVEGGRAGLRRMGFGLLWRMHWELSPLAWPRGWVQFAGSQVAVKRSLARSRGVELARAVELARSHLERQRAIAHVWTREAIAREDGELAVLYRNSFDPERSGDLFVQLAPTCLASSEGDGTTHGTPYPYDRRIPLVFWGPGIESASLPGRAASVDVAPTLAAYLGVPAPPGLDGRVLSLDAASSSTP